MNSEHRIQIGTLADAPQIAALMEAYWRFEGIAGFESARAAALLAHLLSQPHLGTVWTARAADRVVGYLIAVLVFSFEYQGLVAEIDELFVSPQARRDGIGTALLDVAEASLTARGCTCVQLQLNAANDAAHAFYHRRGYVARANYALLDKKLAAPAIGPSVHIT
jgi:ribosomal protein S18 acetylase RimI-like enzyme